MFWVTSHNLKSGQESAYQQWLLSPEYKALIADVEQELGVKYLGAYWTVLGFRDFDCEEWWEVPNWAAVDKVRESQALKKLNMRTWEQGFFDETRRVGQPRVLRTTEEMKTWSPPEKSEG